MPDLSWNNATWGSNYDWQGEGEEWSQAWGGSEAQWFGSLLPRIHRFLPARRVLEIAPGFGRWTRFFVGSGTSYVGIDLSEQCILACKKRFSAFPETEFFVNDGISLDAANGSFDLVFSFDSLVHVEIDIMRGYVSQILSRLTETGVAFLHHSNFLDCDGMNAHRRASTVSAGLVADCIRDNGGHVLVQEKVNWGDTASGGVDQLTDCFTLFSRGNAYHAADLVLDNLSFMDEARIIRETQSKYCL